MTNLKRRPDPAGERAYAAFTRHLPAAEETPPPKPVQPSKRVTDEAIGTLTQIIDALARTEIAILGHLPEPARLKLSRLLLTTAEKADAARTTFSCYAAHGTLTPAGATPRHKHRLKP